MHKFTIRSIQMTVLVAGLVGWVGFSLSLKDDDKLVHRPNVLHLKGSPFGRTLALAMRGPVDVYWHRGNVHEHGHEPGESCAECDHAAEEESAHQEPCAHGEECEHDHGQVCALGENCEHEHGEECLHGAECEHGDHDIASVTPAREERGLRPFLLDRIDGMRKSYYSRTNNRSDTKLHRAYLMGETQRRLEISYHMDPTNLAGYGAYFLFLSEALARVEGGPDEHGIIAAKQQAALQLADYTLKYCLNYQDEAPAMITAATAAHDCLQICLTRDDPQIKPAANYLQFLDWSLRQYEVIREGMIEDGSWQNFSIHRRTEMDQAHHLVRALRAGDHQLFGELSNNSAEDSGQPSS